VLKCCIKNRHQSVFTCSWHSISATILRWHKSQQMLYILFKQTNKQYFWYVTSCVLNMLMHIHIFLWTLWKKSKKINLIMHPFILNDDACIQVNVHNSMKHDKSLKYKSQHNNAHLHDRQMIFFPDIFKPCYLY